MSSTFVTLAEVLEARGGPLLEEEVWSLLLGTAESLVDVSYKGHNNMCNIISPTSLLLSATGTLAFKNCGLSDEVSTFTAPEMLQGRASSTKPAIERPVQLSDHLNSLLLSMCEDSAHRRVNLNSILEACESQHKASTLPSPAKVIRQLVEEVFHESMDHGSLPDSNVPLSGRSQMIRERLHGKRGLFGDFSNGCAEGRRYSTDSDSKSDSPVGFVTGTVTAVGLVGAPITTSLLRHRAGLTVLPSPSSKKGRSCSSQREVTVVLLNGQYVVVRCDIKSRARDVFDMVVAHANLVEHFYFGLAFLDDDEYFFLDHEIKISKVAPDSWKKGQIASFLMFLRVKFFVDDISFILHKLTRHQYYLQLRKDILEDRLYCNEETGLFLAALALQAEFGDYMPELYGKNYYQPEHYVSKRMLEKLALPSVKEELPRLHASHAQMLPEEAETEYLKRRKLIIECGGPSGKKHIFVTESSKIAQYLLNLCSAQHKFHSEMTSRQLNHSMISDENTSVYRGRNLNMKRMSCSEGMLNHVGLSPGQPDSLSKSCDDLTAKMEARLRQQREMRREMSRELNKEPPEIGELRDLKERQYWSTPESLPRRMSSVSLQKQDSDASSSIRVDTPTRTPPEREIICVNLKKDPKLGFGFVIVGEDNTGKLDLGIFIASIVPDGPADKDGRIKPGGRLISLNKTSLEGVTFSDAAAILQSSPEEVELIVSQPKQSLRDSKNSLSQSTLGLALERSFGSQTTLSGIEYRPAVEELEEAITLSNMATPKQGRRLHIPVVRIHDPQDICSRSPSIISLKTGERFLVELKKSSGSLGISVAGGINTNVKFGGIYIKSLVLGGAAEQDGRIQIENTHEVVLKKSLTGLGFSFYISQLRSGPDRGSVVRIKRLFPGQPALESGLLREGDIILSVNKEPVKDLSYQRVLFLLRGAPSEVHLLICRPGPGLLYDVDDNTLSPAPCREVRSRSLDIRLGEDYSQLLKFQHDLNILVQKQPLTQEEDLINTAEKSLESPAAPVLPESQEHLDSEVQANQSPPSSPRSPPSPTSPTSPPSPVSPATPASPASLASPKSQPTARKPEEPQERETKEDNKDGEEASSSTVMLMDVCPKTASNSVYASGVREEADGSVTYCLMGNGLTIMADEEYLTISSTLEPPHSLSSSLATHTPTSNLIGLSSQTSNTSSSFSSQNPNLNSHIPTTTASPLSLTSDTPTTCALVHPSQPLTTQPPKAKHHPVQQGMLPSHYKAISKNSRPVVPPPQPPASPQTPITVQIISSVPPCASPPALTPTVLSSPVQSHTQLREEPEKKEREYKYDDYDEDDDEEESRRKAKFELTVLLTKSRSGSFGFTITRSKLDNCYYIQEILDNPAKADGRLRAGDRLVTVNGHDVTSVADDVAMTILRSSPRRLSMTLGRAVTNLVAPPPCDSLPDIVLYKTPSGQLGIKLTGGIGSKWQGIYCLAVVPGSPASEEGTVQPNDKILYISGRCTLGMTLEDAVKACLFDWKKDRKFFARFEEPASSEKDSPAEDEEPVCGTPGNFRCLSLSQEQDSCIMQVEFMKPEGGGLGFALVGGTNGSMLRVKEICSGGVAEQDGRLRVGDILLEVNGVIVSGLSHSKVVDILRKAEGSVQLTICRDILPLTYSESPTPLNMSAQTAAILAEQPAPVSSPDTCSSPDVMLNKPVERPPVSEATSDSVVNETGVFLTSPPPPTRRLTIVTDEIEIKQESCNSTPSHQACCPSLNVTDMLHGASDRKQIVTKLLDQSCKDIPKTQSDGWSSEEDDDDVFDGTGPPIVSEEELASLALISPAKTSQYSGSRVKALIQILQHQLDQQELVKEFMALEHLKPSDNCLVGKAPENRDKNRYRDILPYDKTRVAIRENQDYINASFIHMQVGAEEFFYISCQGPLPSTYWPEKLAVPLDTGRYQLHLENQQYLEYFHIKVIRMVEIESGETHFVRHLKFTHWPDHGVPQCSEQLVRFIRYLRAVHHKGPVTVHCSAGIGRSGVLICTDIILNLTENDLPINVSNIVKEMRLQRHGMIQTKVRTPERTQAGNLNEKAHLTRERKKKLQFDFTSWQNELALKNIWKPPELLSPEALWVCLEHAQQAALNHKALFFHSPRLPAERKRKKGADLERDAGLGSQGGINQQAGLIRCSAAGFLSPQQASKTDKAPPLSRNSKEEKKNIKHKERLKCWLWVFSGIQINCGSCHVRAMVKQENAATELHRLSGALGKSTIPMRTQRVPMTHPL
ncbi:hypothetical protein PAMP_001715 [Pampus punctatissimus]